MSSTKHILSATLILVILTASMYMLVPDTAKIVFEKTRTKYYVDIDGDWVLGATEYLYVYDGTKKMRAKNRSISFETIGDLTTWIRIANYKENITTIQSSTFDALNFDIENVPIESKAICINCVGKIVHFEYRNLKYDGVTRIALSPESFGNKIKIEWENGYDWAKVYQQKTTGDKLIIRYRPQSITEEYLVRMFDPPSIPNLEIDGNSANVDVEHGSELNLTASIVPANLTICMSADHPDLGTNFSCGTGNTTFFWNATGGVNKFSDDTTSKTFTFNWTTGNHSYIEYEPANLAEVRNGSSFDRTIVDVSGVLANGLVRYDPILHGCYDAGYIGTPAITKDYRFVPGFPCSASIDGDNTTYTKADTTFSNYIYFNFTVPVGADSYDWITHWHSTRMYSVELRCYDWNNSNWDNENVIMNSSLSYTDYVSNDPLPANCVNVTNGRVYAYARNWLNSSHGYSLLYSYIVVDNATYPENVEIDADKDGVADWGMKGSLQGTEAYKTRFDYGNQIKTSAFITPGTQVDYITLPAEYNITNFTITITPDKTYKPVSTSGSIASTDLFVGFGAAHAEDTDDFYLFGGAVYDVDSGGSITSISEFNRTYKWQIGSDNVTRLDDAPKDIGSFPCVVYWNDTSQHGGNGFMIFGGSNATDYMVHSYFYNISGTNWVQLADLPAAANHIACYHHKDGVLLAGGSTVANPTGMNVTRFYNATANSYSTKAEIPRDVYSGDLARLDNERYFYLGDTTYRLIYNSTSNAWLELGSYGCHVEHTETVELNNVVYCVMGYESGESASLRLKQIANDEKFYYMDANQSDNSLYGGGCDVVDNRTVCIWGGLNTDNPAFKFQEIYFNPSNVQLSLGAQGLIWNHSGVMMDESTTDNLASYLNDELVVCTQDSEGYCEIPLYITSAKNGVVSLSDLNISYTVDNANLSLGTINCSTPYCNATLNISSTMTGKVNISNLNVTFTGTASVIINASTTGEYGYDASSESHTLSLYYSAWDYNLPGNLQYIEFIPNSYADTEVEPYGQSAGIPIMNVSYGSMNDKNASWYALVLGNHSCVNLTFNNERNYSTGTLMQNNSWIEFIDNTAADSIGSLYMWVDLNCNYSSLRLWEPYYYFRACCEGCICDNSTS